MQTAVEPAGGLGAPRIARPAVAVILVLFLIGFLLRIVTVAVAFGSPQYNPYRQIARGEDKTTYTSLAVSLAKGEGYSKHYFKSLPEFFKDPAHFRPAAAPRPTAVKAVGYPWFLAVLFRVFGFHLAPVLVVQALLGALSALLVYAIGLKVGSWKLALTAYLAAIFYYPLWCYCMMLMVETLLIFLTLLFLYGFICWLMKPAILTAWWTGLAAGATFLVRPFLLPAVPFFLMAAYLRFRRRDMRRAFWTGAIALISGLVLMVAPLAVRNYRHTGRFFITPSFGGYHLLLLYNRANRDFALYRASGFMDEDHPGFRSEVLPALAVRLPEGTDPVLAEYLQDEAYARAATGYVLEHPRQLFRTIPRTMWNMWQVHYPKARMLQKLSEVVEYAALAPFVVFGVIAAFRRRNHAAIFLVGFLIYFAAFHALRPSVLRYRLVAMPVWFVLAGLGLRETWHAWERCLKLKKCPS